MQLRPYQSEAVEAVEAAWLDAQAALVVMPTGTGKTQVFADIIRRRMPAGRALVLAHREELIFQAAARIRQIAGVKPGIEMASSWAESHGMWADPVVVSTVQTQVAGKNGGRMTRFPPDAFATIIVDEAHHAPARTYRKVLDHYKQNPACRILGVTATPDRHDEKALGAIFDTVAYDYEIPDAIRDGWLVPVKARAVEVQGLDLSSVRTTAGDLNGADLARVLEEEAVLHEMAAPILEIGGGRRTLVFVASVVQAERMAEILNRPDNAPGSARWICGTTPREERRAILRDYNAGRFPILVNVGIATEGFDSPGIEIVAMGRPTKSRALYAQMAGRGTRTLPGVLDGLDEAPDRVAAIAASQKPSCEIVDFVGNAGRHKLVTTADILGGEYSGEEVERAAAIVRRADGEAVDSSSALDEARAELLAEKKRAEDERRRRAAERRHVTPRARYGVREVDPFGLHDLAPVRRRPRGAEGQLTDRQESVLRARGIDPDEIDYARAKQMIAVIFKRDLPTLKQKQILQRAGWWNEDMTKTQASARIDYLARNNWRRP